MKKVFKNIYLNIIDYIISNRLFLTYCIFAYAGTLIIRATTIGDVFTPVSMLIDLGFILIMGAFAYLFKPKNQFKYLACVLFFIYFTTVSNSIYYTFYTNFASLSLVSTLSQTGEVTDSVFSRLKLMDFIYIPMLITFILVHLKLKKSTYYNYMAHVENGKKNMAVTIIVGLIILIVAVVQLTPTDYSRLSKQWNREYNVRRFGIIMYQYNDIFQSLVPKVNSLFGYDKAVSEYKEFFLANEEHKNNQYTNIFEGKNVIFVHMESIQDILFDFKFNGQEVVPNIKKLANEGMYFNNFHPQISTGTSSDTEFTLNTSLMPALSGTVAVSYYDRNYVTIEKLLKEKDYYTFSMHGNKASMWNREKLHNSFGYDRFYSEKDFKFDESGTVGLGISDQEFFKQIMPYLEEIELNNEHYMGTIITLSNHSPFADLDKYGPFDLSVSGDHYLEGTELGNYLHSAHYADMALGEFISYVNNSNYFNNTIFVFYGDHEAKISRSQYNKYFNYDVSTGQMYNKTDERYDEYDKFEYDLNKNTPLIIWSKDANVRKQINSVVSYPMGMYDVLPTIGNMMGFKSDYALGHDIFDIKDNNIVIFPNGNVLTSKVYYNNANEEYRVLNTGVTISEDYIKTLKEYAEKRLGVSNSIIVHNLIKKEPINTEGGNNEE